MRTILISVVFALSSLTTLAQLPTDNWLSYTDVATGLSVKYPTAWRLKTTNPKTPIVLHAPSEDDNDTFSENINYLIQRLPDNQAITIDDVAESMRSTLSNMIDDYVLLEEKKMTWIGSPAVEILYTGTSKGENGGVKIKILQRMGIVKGHLLLATYTAQNSKTDVSWAEAIAIIDLTSFDK